MREIAIPATSTMGLTALPWMAAHLPLSQSKAAKSSVATVSNTTPGVFILQHITWCTRLSQFKEGRRQHHYDLGIAHHWPHHPSSMGE